MGGLLNKKKRGDGVLGKIATHLPPLVARNRGGAGGAGGLWPVALGAGGGREGGGNEEGSPGNRFPSSIYEERARREGATAMAVTARRRPWRRHSEVRWRPGLGERARGVKGFPSPL